MDHPEAAWRSFLRIGVHRCRIGGISVLVSMLFSLWFAIVIGRNLGLFLGGFVLVSILAPLLVIAELDFFRRFSIQCGIVGGVAIIWLNCVFNDTITPGEWLRVTLVLLIYTLAIAGLAAVVARIRIPPAVIVILSLAWLSWPIWLAPALRGRQSSERTVAVLVAANPTFAIQGALSKSFNVPWAQYRIAYRLTNIGDDISYDMPRSILFCVMVHGIIAAIAMLAAHWPTREPSPVPPEHPPADQSPRST